MKSLSDGMHAIITLRNKASGLVQTLDAKSALSYDDATQAQAYLEAIKNVCLTLNTASLQNALLKEKESGNVGQALAWLKANIATILHAAKGLSGIANRIDGAQGHEKQALDVCARKMFVIAYRDMLIERKIESEEHTLADLMEKDEAFGEHDEHVRKLLERVKSSIQHQLG